MKQNQTQLIWSSFQRKNCFSFRFTLKNLYTTIAVAMKRTHCEIKEKNAAKKYATTNKGMKMQQRKIVPVSKRSLSNIACNARFRSCESFFLQIKTLFKRIDTKNQTLAKKFEEHFSSSHMDVSFKIQSTMSSKVINRNTTKYANNCQMYHWCSIVSMCFFYICSAVINQFFLLLHRFCSIAIISALLSILSKWKKSGKNCKIQLKIDDFSCIFLKHKTYCIELKTQKTTS